jgi:DNA-binding GntR family transcriptional regulator
MAVTKTTLAEQAYATLHRQIVGGELASGQRLLAEELASVMEISPTPIKEALVRLEAEGLLVAEMRRGVVVRRFTAGDVQELYDARVLIELNALRTGFAQSLITDAFRARLHAISTQHLAAANRGTLRGLREALRLDRLFHAEIVGLSRNKVIAAWHRRVINQTHTVRTYSLETYVCPRLAVEHAGLVAALNRGDLAQSVDLLQAHLHNSRDELLQRSGFAAQPPAVVVRRRHRRAGA